MSLAVTRGRNFCRPLCDSPDCGERSVLTDRCNSRACWGLRVRKRASEGRRLTVWEKGSDGKRGKRRNWDGKSVQGDRISKKRHEERVDWGNSGKFVDGCAAYLLYALSFFLSLVDIDIFCKTHENKDFFFFLYLHKQCFEKRHFHWQPCFTLVLRFFCSSQIELCDWEHLTDRRGLRSWFKYMLLSGFCCSIITLCYCEGGYDRHNMVMSVQQRTFSWQKSINLALCDLLICVNVCQNIMFPAVSQMWRDKVVSNQANGKISTHTYKWILIHFVKSGTEVSGWTHQISEHLIFVRKSTRWPCILQREASTADSFLYM